MVEAPRRTTRATRPLVLQLGDRSRSQFLAASAKRHHLYRNNNNASEDDDKPRVEVDEALRKKREQAVLDALWKKKDQREGTMWRKSSAVRKTSIALQFGVSRGLNAVACTPRRSCPSLGRNQGRGAG